MPSETKVHFSYPNIELYLTEMKTLIFYGENIHLRSLFYIWSLQVVQVTISKQVSYTSTSSNRFQLVFCTITQPFSAIYLTLSMVKYLQRARGFARKTSLTTGSPCKVLFCFVVLLMFQHTQQMGTIRAPPHPPQ